MKKSNLVVVLLEAVAIAVILLITVSLVIGSLDELAIKTHLNSALDFFHGNRWDEALHELAYCMKKKPDFAPPFEMAGYIYLIRGDLDAAEKTYKAAVENAGEKATPSSVLGLIITETVRTAFKKQDASGLKAAARTIESMKDEGKNETDALISAAAIMALAGDLSGAKKTLRLLKGREAAYAMGSLPVSYNTEGLLAYDKDLKEDSRTFFRKAARLAGPWQTPQTNFSVMFVATVSAQETPKELLHKLVPDLLSTGVGTATTDQGYLYHNALGVIAYMRLGSDFYSRSIDQFDKAIVLKPDESGALINKATVMTLQGSKLENKAEKDRLFGEADRLYGDVLKKRGLDSDTKYLVLNGLGILSASRGNKKEALEYFEEAFKMRSDDYLVCRNIGSLYYRLKRYDLAKNYLIKSSGFLAGQKDVDEALEVLQTAPKIESASIRYTVKSKPVVVVKAKVHSSPTTVEHCKVQITFNNTHAYFLAKPGHITCIPVYDLPAGKYKLKVVLTDPSGNKAARSFDLSVDISPPKVEAVIPPRNGSVKGPNPEISIKVYDELSMVDLSTLLLRYRTDPEATEIVSQDVIKNGRYCYDMPELKIERNQAVSSETIRFVSKTKLSPGNYRLQAEAKDVLGNSGVERWDFTVTE